MTDRLEALDRQESGWYDDPWMEASLRYWDGSEWTSRTANPAGGVGDGSSESVPGPGDDADPVPPTCPSCSNADTVPIIYGAPSPTHLALCAGGRAVPGGAMGRVVAGGAPTWQCQVCGHRWRGGMFSGGPGDNVETAVAIHGATCTAVGIRAEYQYLSEQFGPDHVVAGDPSGWDVVDEAHFESADGHHYDVITIRRLDGEERTVFFDVSDFFGLEPV
jgi:Protein of unknown function (DUF2510)